MNIEFDLGFGKPADEIRGDRPLNVLIVGNFSGSDPGSGDRAGQTAVRNMFKFDPYDLDAAIRRVGPGLAFGEQGRQERWSIGEFDDFHPDELLAKFPAFSTIRELKQALADPARAESALELGRRLLGLEGQQPPAPPGDRPGATAEAAEDPDDVFGRLLGRPASKSAPGNPAARAAVQRILEQVAPDPGAASAPTGAAAEVHRGLDEWLVAALRDLLHLPSFQRLEANWRGVRWFGEQLDVDFEVECWLADVGAGSPTSWAPDLGALITQSMDRVDMLIVLETIDTDDESIAALSALMELASGSNGRLLSGAAPALAGLARPPGDLTALDRSHLSAEPVDAFQRLRSQPGARRIALGIPRILLRQPYGKSSDPIESFPFEELEPAPSHESFLWGNPALALALMSLMDTERLENLPMVVFDDGGGQAIKPPSETYLTESAGDELLRRGFVPIYSHRGGTDVRVPRLQTIAAVPTAV